MDGLWFVAGMIAGAALATLFIGSLALSRELWSDDDEH
jgi:hypothetical protein